MPDSIENLIRLAYKEWKKEGSKKSKTPHPDPELLTSFYEKPLSAKEDQGIKLHLILCDSCSEILAAHLVIEIDFTQEIPPDLIKWAKKLPVCPGNTRVLAKISRLKKKVILKLAAHKFIATLSLLQRQLRLIKFNFR